MKITVTTATGSDSIFNLDVSEDLELENFKAFCEVESGIPAKDIRFYHNGRPIVGDKKSLKDHGLKEGDIVLIQADVGGGGGSSSSGRSHLPTGGTGGGAGLPRFDFGSIQVPTSRPGSSGNPITPRPGPGEEDPAVIRDQLLANPEQIALLKQNNPPLADALLSGDFETFSKIIRLMQQQHREREMQRLRLLTADSMDIEAQRLIEAEIRQKQVDQNMEAAMEYNPESFGTVCMLYINCRVNGVPVKAFIDSGAQATIMSTDCAERCKIMRLVDTRFSGIAKGVGTQKIIGRIHMTQIQIENDFFVSSFTILQDQKMDMLLGLDMLKRHQCVIDLKRNCLVIGTTATETTFLPESELPESARLTNNMDVAEHEKAIHDLGGEDAGLAKAIEESMKEEQKNHKKDPAGSSTSGAATTASAGAGDQQSQSFPEESIQQMTKYGFPREQVICELRRYHGDVTQALAALLAKSLPKFK